MNCRQVERRLSEYLDSSLDLATAEAVANHLSLCDHCRAEADLLAECVRQVAALGEVEPPIGFAQRVIAHVKEIEARPAFWDGLFMAFKTHAPLQATVLVLIGMLALFIAEQEPHRQPFFPQDRFALTIRQQARPEPVRAADEVKNQAPGSPAESNAAEPSAALHPEAPPARSHEDSPPRRAGKKAGAPKAADNAAPVALAERAPPPEDLPSPAPAEGVAALAPESVPAPRQKVTVPVVADPSPLANQPAAIAPPLLPELFEMMGIAPAGALSSFSSDLQRIAPAADIEVIVRRRPQSIAPNVKEHAGLQKQVATATVPTTPREVDRLAPPLPLPESARQVVWLTIPYSHYEKIKNKLATIGTIESESRNVGTEPASASRAESSVRVLIMILPPGDLPLEPPAGSLAR
ncbi:MAG TPA: zf-HC2 domain-containing protein [Candidatus Eisenbacteria bacterium]|nr:zf-HC2 domain-containing protein [Candidatus Eisenbacteria bacterium]